MKTTPTAKSSIQLGQSPLGGQPMENLSSPSQKSFDFKDKAKSFYQSIQHWQRQIGTVPFVMIVLILGIALIVPEKLGFTLDFTLTNVISIFPYLLLSIGVASYIKASSADKVVSRVFSGHPLVVILMASAFGALSPFCSCGVIPLIAALLTSGVPLSAVMAFWIASPVMDPQMFIVTAGVLGSEFAIAKTVATMGVGMMAGLLTWGLQTGGAFSAPLREDLNKKFCTASLRGKVVWKFWQETDRTTAFFQEMKKTGLFLLQWLVLAYILESLMVTYLPAEKMTQWLGKGDVGDFFMTALIGVPTYLNGFAAIPLAAGLIESGVSQGLILTFMLAGAITSIPAAVAVYSLVKKQVFGWYLFLAFLGAILSGQVFQWYLY